jgi:ankyrin repeat protein
MKNNAKQQQEQQREKDEHKSYAHYLKAVREGNVHAFDDLDDDDDDDDQKLESFLEKSLANASSLKDEDDDDEEDERSFIHVAAANGHGDLLELFLNTNLMKQKGGEFLEHPEKGEWGGTPLHSATAGGHMSTVSILLAAGANANAKTRGRDLTALHYASSKGYGDIARKLIEAGADVNAKDASGNAPAHRAASQGRLAVLKVLFTEDTELGTKIDERDSCGSTPLLVAAEAGQDECAIFLAKCGANVHAVDNEKHGVPERLRGVLKSI